MIESWNTFHFQKVLGYGNSSCAEKCESMVIRLQFPNCAEHKPVSVNTALTGFEVSKDDDVRL